MIEAYPLLNWNKIWENLNNPYIGLREREFMFKYLHDRLPTNVRLNIMGIKNDSKCNFCNDTEYPFHIFYFCDRVKSAFTWFKNSFYLMCKIESKDWLKLLMLDVKGKNKRDNNTAVFLICNYLYCIWISRMQRMNEREILNFVKGRFHYLRWMICNVYEKEIEKILTRAFLVFDF